jgi:hypothetical protein
MRLWKVAILVGALALVGLLAGVAIAASADTTVSGTAGHGTGEHVGQEGQGQGHGNGGEGGGNASSRGLGASEEMAAWRDKYGDDPQSAEAQQALEAIREEHRSEMESLGGGSGAGKGSDKAENGHGSAECDESGTIGECDGEDEAHAYGQGGGSGQAGGSGEGGGHGW